MVVASTGRANRNDSSELVMRYMTQRIAFIPKGWKQSSSAMMANRSKFRVQFNACPELGEWVQG
jgi:hypothetical protein